MMNIVDMAQRSQWVMVGRMAGDVDVGGDAGSNLRCVTVSPEETILGGGPETIVKVVVARPSTGPRSAPLLLFGERYLLFLRRYGGSSAAAERLRLPPDELYEMTDLDGAFLLFSDFAGEPSNQRLLELSGIRAERDSVHLLAGLQSICAILEAAPDLRPALAGVIAVRQDPVSRWLWPQLQLARYQLGGVAGAGKPAMRP